MKKYKLKTNKITDQYIKFLCNELNVYLHYKNCKEFTLDKNTPGLAGGFFTAEENKKSTKYLFVNDYMPVPGPHDLIVFHEIGHMLLNNTTQMDSEMGASNLALCLAKVLKIKVSKNQVKILMDYSKEFKK